MSNGDFNSKTDPPDAPGPKKAASKVDALISASRPEALRRSERAFLRIPIQVEGIGENGQPFSERTNTLIINRHGARISLKATVRPEDRVKVTNLQNSMSCEFRMVERVAQVLGEGPEWGIECLQTETRIWGISFPEKVIERSPTPSVNESVDALLECSVCRADEFAQLTLDDYRQLASRMQLERSCPQCGQPTAWRFGVVEAVEEDWGSPRREKVTAGAEKRRAKRLAIKLPVKIRLPEGAEELARTEDISKTGVCFSSSLDLQEGERIHVSVGYSEGSAVAEIEARVVWRREVEAGKTRLYGVRLEDVPEEP